MKESTELKYNLITSGNKEEHSGTVIDSNLTFEDQINNFCKKASQKLALGRISLYMNFATNGTVLRAFATPQFGCYLLFWMFF